MTSTKTTTSTKLIAAAAEFARAKSIVDAHGDGSLVADEDEMGIACQAFNAAEQALFDAMDDLNIEGAVLPDGSLVTVVWHNQDEWVGGVVPPDRVLRL